MASPKRSGLQRILFALIAALLGVIFALVIGEVALRIWDPLHLPLEDMRGFYRLDAGGRIETTPGWTGAQLVEGRPVPVHMNALGLRGPEIGTRQPGEKRVLVLGDSFVWGQGVLDAETIPARLQAGLAAAGKVITVGNAGMFGTGPREWSYTLERHRSTFQPDLVVAVMYVGNDVLDSLMDPLDVYDGWLMISGTAKLKDSWRFRMMMSSRLWNMGERLFAKNRIDTMVTDALARYTPRVKTRVDDAVFLDRDPARDADEPLIGNVESVLGDFFHAFAAAAKGVPTFVVLLPGHEVALKPYPELLQAYHLDPALHERGRGHARIARLFAKEGLDVVDLAPQILAAPDRKPLFLPIDWHFSALGCQRVADWLLPEVERRLQNGR
ncbi:MAG: SGNH/GDSL hydrolase family protein [Planctomycetota bacterium]